MKTLDDPNALGEVLERLGKLTPQSTRHWGRMTPNQMVYHLSDSMKAVIGEKPISRVDNFISRSVVKWIGLKVPIKWVHGLRTMPEMDQMLGGTAPTEFERDRDELQGLLIRFIRRDKDFEWKRHPMFGQMSEWEWQRWAYLHADHHFRQFGV